MTLDEGTARNTINMVAVGNISHKKTKKKLDSMIVSGLVYGKSVASD